MTIRGYVTFMVLGSALAWLAWYVVLSTVDPFIAGFTGVMMFYGSLGLATLGTLTLLVFVARTLVHKDELAVRNLGIAVREAFWGVLFLVIILILLRRGLLAWWNALPLFVGLAMAEYACLAMRRRPHHISSRPPIRTIQ